MRLETQKPLDTVKQLSVAGVRQQAAIVKFDSEVDTGALTAEKGNPRPSSRTH
jgi:hypothetical protein